MKSQILHVVLLAAIGNSMHISSALPLSKNQKEDVRIVEEGQPIILNCDANGQIQASFHWLFEDKYVEQSPLDNLARNLISSPTEHMNVEVYAELYIKNAKPEHAGIYICIADSLTHRVARSFTVKVVQRNEITEGESEKPENKDLRIYQWTKSIMQEEGKPIYAICRATQGEIKPAPAIRWTIGDTVITENENIKIHSNGDLEVSKVTLHFHEWDSSRPSGSRGLTCHAISDDGHTIVSKESYVYIAPLIDDGAKRPRS